MALETSGNTASVAAFDDERLLATGESDPKLRTAACLAPQVRDVVSRAGFGLHDVRLISSPVGPGSFTGLRVGVTTAKTLAYALGCEVLGLDTLEVIACQAPSHVLSLWSVVDAQRQQLFVRKFTRKDGRWNVQDAAKIVDNDEFVAGLTASDVVSGPGLNRIVDRIPPSVVVIDETLWTPRAETVGRLAHAKYQAGERGDLWQLVPQYFRPSAAEEKKSLPS